MRKPLLIMIAMLPGFLLFGGNVEKTYFFANPVIRSSGSYHTVSLSRTQLSGIPGEPSLPYQSVALLLPPGEAALSIEILGEDETRISGSYILAPQQYDLPLSEPESGGFIRNDKVYRQKASYPPKQEGHLMTQFLNGYSFALCSFTPVRYKPASGQLSYYRKVTVKIRTRPDERAAAALKNLSASGRLADRVNHFAQNPEASAFYPRKRSPATSYQYLIISPVPFQNEFQPMIAMYAAKGIACEVVTTKAISATTPGTDAQAKIRNYIINEYQDHGIEYVLLAGNKDSVPYRGFYCHVISQTNYDDWNIPADLYYSGLDGTYNADNDQYYAELEDDPDLLPDIAVGRFPADDTAGLHHMIHKTIAYQTNPVLGEFAKPLLLGEYLYNAPLTMGGDYMNLLVDDRSDNGYFTHGIPSCSNTIGRLYDTLIPPNNNIWYWTKAMLLTRLNQGNSFIHHLGHSNTTYMLKMNTPDITNANFSQVNGIIHNYQILYTQGCYCGSFDIAGCIASKAVSIDNFLVGGVFNSRYGWFNQGTTDGPSEHLEREFVSAIYTDTMPDNHLGEAHRISKVETVPYLTLPGEFEPGAQRWCHYCANVFGDPALAVWTAEPTLFTQIQWTGSINTDWNNPGNWNPQVVPTSLNDVLISPSTNPPLITTLNSCFCHDLVVPAGSKFTVGPGKSVLVRGDIIISP
jgi:hypothetical protein